MTPRHVPSDAPLPICHIAVIELSTGCHAGTKEERMFADRRVLIAITALVALRPADAPASPIHRCHQHGCKAHEPLRSDFDPPHSGQFGWRYVHHSPGRWLF